MLSRALRRLRLEVDLHKEATVRWLTEAIKGGISYKVRGDDGGSHLPSLVRGVTSCGNTKEDNTFRIPSAWSAYCNAQVGGLQ
jgi:hypothetical protein